MMTSSFAKPRKSGMRTCRSGLPPATHAAWHAYGGGTPVVTMPHSAPVSSASRLPAASMQLVERDVLAIGQHLRGAHLRQLDGAADDGDCAATVDDSAHAKRLVDVGCGL